jgi:3-dehydroquinate synthase
MIWTGLDIATALSQALEQRVASGSVFFLCSQRTQTLCDELIELAEIQVTPNQILSLPDGELAKNLAACERVYEWLQKQGAQRDALLINVGGGALCDVGGFCGATYMRGIAFWNIPTTLLAMVDAAVGGKNGINLGHHKNYIGTFQEAEKVFVAPRWLNTLPASELLSGWAEVIKHGILSGGKKHLQILKPIPPIHDQQQWLDILEWNIKVKSRIVEADFKESGSRKLLNLGHTIGHALESWSLDMKRPISHGCAVAWGLVIETFLAIAKSQNADETRRHHQEISELVKSLYPNVGYRSDDIPALMSYILADKKNQQQELLFSLAFAPGDCAYNVMVAPEAVIDALKAFSDDPH